VDGTGTIVLVNREIERMFGWTRQELVGRPIETLVPERYRGGHAGQRAAFLGDPRTRAMGAGRELCGIRRDGTEFPLEIGLNPVRTERGLYVLASVVDITARRDLDQKARQSQKLEAIGTLAGGIAHDFNNILSSIVGYTELAMSGQEPDRQREDLLQVLKSADRGRLLVQRILAFSRQNDPTRAPVRLEHTVGETLQLLRASLPSTIQIRTSMEPAPPAVLADETQIQQVLMNLVTNGAQAMPDGGVLTISVAAFEVTPEFAESHAGPSPGRHARIAVSDTGTGMSPEVAERAFEPFFTTKPAGVGTGLGLSVVHGIVRSHGGVVEIESEVGRGTTVTVYLPASEGDARTEPAETSGEAAPPRHILLVEDEVELASMRRRQLERAGYHVTAHTSSVEALEDFRARPDAFDLLMTDNTMPRMTGLALVQEVLQIRPRLPVLMVSGIAEVTDAETLRARGVGRLLAKPHTWRELEQALRELLEPAGEA
jgi:hypothetical protein